MAENSRKATENPCEKKKEEKRKEERKFVQRGENARRNEENKEKAIAGYWEKISVLTTKKQTKETVEEKRKYAGTTRSGPDELIL